MRVFLAEKPSQGRDIARVIGCNQREDGYLYNNQNIVTWGFGHLLGLANPDKYDEKYKKWNIDDLPILPTSWKLEKNQGSQKQLSVVASCLKKATEVVIATDSDREGELIARLILGNLRYNGPTKRLWLSSLDDESIKKALSNLKDKSETENLFRSALARSRADWLVGMNYTRASTIAYGSYGSVLSVGRVQTPTLSLIVARDKEIKDFKSKNFFNVEAIINTKLGDIKTQWIVPDYAKGDENGRCLDISFAQKVIEKCLNSPCSLVSSTDEIKEKQAPLCLSLSELQKIANNQYGLSAKKTLDTLQNLYEKHKATTYPRTDCQYLPLSQLSDIDTILNNLSKIDENYANIIEKCSSKFKSRAWNDKKVNESSHHAIIPTIKPNINIDTFSKDEKNVFDLVVRHYLAQFMKNSQISKKNVVINCCEELFKTTAISIVEKGWNEALEPLKSENSKNKVETIPNIQKSDVIDMKKCEIIKNKTTPPSFYNESTLISAMQNCGRKMDNEEDKKILSATKGIGTEATRASVIETLKTRKYIVKKGKNIQSTPIGQQLISQLPTQLTSVLLTAEWEKKLFEIETGQYSYNDFIENIKSSISSNIIDIKNNKDKKSHKIVNNPCPKCGSELVKLKDKNDDTKYFWMCSEIKNGCKTFLDDKKGKPIESKKSTTKKKSTNSTKSKGKKYHTEKCPNCNSKMVIMYGKYDGSAGCSNYPKCKTIINLK